MPSDKPDKDESAEITSAEGKRKRPSAEVTSAEGKRHRAEGEDSRGVYMRPVRSEIGRVLGWMRELWPRHSMCIETITNEEELLRIAVKVLCEEDASCADIRKVMTVLQFSAEQEEGRPLISQRTNKTKNALLKVTDTDALFEHDVELCAHAKKVALNEVRRMFWAAVDTLTILTAYTRNNAHIRAQQETSAEGEDSHRPREYPTYAELEEVVDLMWQLWPPGICKKTIPNSEAFIETAYKVMRNRDPMDISHEEILEVMKVVQYFAEQEDRRLLISDDTENKAKALAKVTDTGTRFGHHGCYTPPMELAIEEVRRMFWAALNTLRNIAAFTRNNTLRNARVREQMESDERSLPSPLPTIPR